MWPKKGNSAADIMSKYGFQKVVETNRRFFQQPDVMKEFPNGLDLFERELDAISHGLKTVK